MSGVRGNLSSLRKLRQAIADLPPRMRRAVATEAAEALDVEIKNDFAAGRTVYDTPRPLGVNGNPLSLVKTGRAKRGLGVTAFETIVRAELPTRYAKYLVGKYRVMPQTLPVTWQLLLQRIVGEYRDDWAREQARELAR